MINYLHEKEPDNEGVKRLKNRYRHDILSELHKGSTNTSYSINKGEKIVFCLRMRDEGNNLVDENTLTYVAVHELAHVATKEIGHVPIYWENFKWLLTIAKEKGIYKYVNYSDKPQSYCGLLISNNVLDN